MSYLDKSIATTCDQASSPNLACIKKIGREVTCPAAEIVSFCLIRFIVGRMLVPGRDWKSFSAVVSFPLQNSSKLSLQTTQSDPLRHLGHKRGTNMVVHQVGRRKRKCRPISKNACYDRVVKPTKVQCTRNSTGWISNTANNLVIG